MSSKLHVRPHEDGITCTVVGDGNRFPEAQVESWRRTAESAVKALGQRNSVVTWEAIIGTDPYVLGMDRQGPSVQPGSLAR